MGADREGDRQPLAARDAGLVDPLQVRRSGDVGAGFIAVAQAEPPAADIAPPRRRIDREVHRGTQIAAAVIGVLRMERQPRQIDVAAGKDNLVDRRGARGDLYHRLRIGETPVVGVVHLVLHRAERGGEPPVVAGSLGDQLDTLGSGLFEQHRL